jgi:hypothetical protein
MGWRRYCGSAPSSRTEDCCVAKVYKNLIGIAYSMLISIEEVP